MFIILSPSQRSPQRILLVIALSRVCRGGVQTPAGLQGLGHLPGLAELQVTRLLRHDGALVLRCQLWHQLCHKSAGLLGVEVTLLLGHIHQCCHNLVMALLLSLLISAASSTNLNGKLLTGSVSNKLAGLLLHILGGAGGLVHSPALLRALTIADLLNGSIAFLHSFIEGFLFEGDGTSFLEVLLADLLLTGGELGDVGVVTLLRVLVGAL